MGRLQDLVSVGSGVLCLCQRGSKVGGNFYVSNPSVVVLNFKLRKKQASRMAAYEYV